MSPADTPRGAAALEQAAGALRRAGWWRHLAATVTPGVPLDAALYHLRCDVGGDDTRVMHGDAVVCVGFSKLPKELVIPRWVCVGERGPHTEREVAEYALYCLLEAEMAEAEATELLDVAMTQVLETPLPEPAVFAADPDWTPGERQVFRDMQSDPARLPYYRATDLLNTGWAEGPVPPANTEADQAPAFRPWWVSARAWLAETAGRVYRAVVGA